MPLLQRLLHRLRGGGDVNLSRVRRRQALVNTVTRRVNQLTFLLLLIGYLWIIAIPSPRLGRGTFMDENAIQPGQVNTNWNWGDVHTADQYLAQLETIRDGNFSSAEKASWLKDQFVKQGLTASTQQYSFSTSLGDANGTNAYAIIAAPRTSGAEAMVISASWLSRTGEGDGTLNLRGVATVLALANFLKQYSYWSKDIIFMLSDGYLEGMQAWLSAYHGESQTGLTAEPLNIPSAVIWTALNIDYPGHSFSHLGIFHEGTNGRLPNQDLINAASRIARWTAGVPTVLYDHLNPAEDTSVQIKPWWMPEFLTSINEVKTYLYQGKNFLRHVKYQAGGQGSGVHGLFHQFRIDALTLFAVPAVGPHGFHAIGRTVESTLRSMGNLLERLHASFFFYILTSPDRFLQVGHYLASPILISSAMMFRGLKLWNDAAWFAENTEKPKWRSRRRPVIGALSIMLALHVAGVSLFALLNEPGIISDFKAWGPVIGIVFALIPVLGFFLRQPQSRDVASVGSVLKAFNLCLASTVISAITVLNFSLAACLAVVLGFPLSAASSLPSIPLRTIQFASYIALGLGWVLFTEEVKQAIWSWQVLRVWTAPFVCIVYVPILLQAALASAMS